ncbi:MAG TPA: hypothetical protein VMU24_09520 [Candidatus Acidoferrales bacterium]|nr:hypothetical protein [Candidatus Acidoferrales bacterium]
MFINLLVSTLAVSIITAAVVMVLFSRPISKLLKRIVSDDLAPVWQRYITFAIFVVGISGGVRFWDLERYLTPDNQGKLLQLNSERWVLELYKTILGALQGLAWMLLVFFLFALLAYVVLRGFEMRHEHSR